MPRTLEQMIEAHERLQSGASPALNAHYESLGLGQSPEVCLVTCSDSRIAPEELLGAGAGDLFVIRNAGNIVPDNPSESGELASIRYAVAILGVKHLVVCGHSGCGAMSGIQALESTRPHPEVHAWLARASESLTPIPESLDELVQKNVQTQLARLAATDFIAEATRAGRLSLHGWVLNIAAHRIDRLNEDGQCVPLCREAA